MRRLRFVVIGSGWRSLFYYRIAKGYPQRFSFLSMVVRTEEKAKFMREQYHIPVTMNPDEAKAMQPDFVVVAVNKASISEVSLSWARAGFPVLCETPVGITMDNLLAIWKGVHDEGLRIVCAEQYSFYPSIRTMLTACDEGLIGDIDSIYISRAHGYHGMSLIRKFLNIGFQHVRISAKAARDQVRITGSRNGFAADGEIKEKLRTAAHFTFENGKSALYDFESEQYHSLIRGNYIIVRGTEGEIFNDTVHYMQGNACMTKTLAPEEPGWLKDVVQCSVFTEPDEDELAISVLLDGMEEYIESGRFVYPIEDALEDAYFSILMEQAAKTGSVVESENMPWKE